MRSVVEAETVQAGAGQPLMAPRRQVHREVDVASEGREPGRVEPAYGGHYTGTPAAIIWHFQRTGA